MKVLKKVGSWLALSILSLMVLAGCSAEKEPVENGSSGIEKETETIKSTVSEHENFLFRYNIKNTGAESYELEFPSGQRFDYEVTNFKGEVVHLFSSTAMFMQALGTETIPAGESLEFDLDLSSLELESGSYTLKVWLTPTEGETQLTKSDFKIK